MGISAGQIEIQGSVCFQKITALKIAIKANEHAKAYVKGVIDRETAKNTWSKLEESSWIQIVVSSKPPNRPVCFFYGYMDKAKVIERKEFYEMELELSSGTRQIDKEHQKRSFQDQNVTYKQIIEKVMGEKKGSFLWEKGTPEKVGKPIIQYEETDWEFLLRLARRMKTVVYPEWRIAGSHIYIGMPRSKKEVTFSEREYQVGISKRYLELGGEAAGYQQSDFLYYQVKSYEDYEIGSQVHFQGKSFRICEKEIKLEKQEILFYYLLGREELERQKEPRQKRMTGLTLTGTILSVKGEKVKLAWDIDGGKQEENTAYPFSWVPDTGSVMYCMPKVGSQASLYFPSEREESAMAVHCVRMNGESCEKLGNSKKKGLSTEHGKELSLEEEKLELISEESGVRAALEDTLAIFLESKKKIHVEGAAIEIKGKTVRIETPVELNMRKK